MSDSNSMTIQEQTNSFQLQQMNPEEQIISRINKFRFKSKSLITTLKQVSIKKQRLLKIIQSSVQQEKKELNFPSIGKKVQYKDQLLLERFCSYLDDIDVVNQILPDYSCNSKFLDLFKKRFGPILQFKGQVLMGDDNNVDLLKRTLKSQSFYGYSIQNINLNNLDEIIMLMMIEEFLLLNDINYKSQNINIESVLSGTLEHLGLLSHDFTSICVRVEPTSIQIKDGSLLINQNVSIDVIPKTMNIYILLSASEMFSEINVQSFKNSIRKTQQSGIQNTQISRSNNLNSATILRDFSIVPQKYANHVQRTTQIPKTSIIRLIEQMDTNNDGLITVEDIKNFSEKHFLFYNYELSEKMFKEASSKRVKIIDDKSKNPLSVEEIHAADEQHRWVENPRQFREQWIKLLEAAGEKLPNQHDLSPIRIDKVKDVHELPESTFKPKLNETKTAIIIKTIPPLTFTSPYRPEAGIIINNTPNLQEMIVDNQIYDPNSQDAFQKVVNSKIKYSEIEQEFPTIKFETKQYYLEAERLSKRPELLSKGRNPIYSYLPENMNFQIKPKENTDIDSLMQTKRFTQFKMSKGFSNLNSPDFHESGFYKEIDEIKQKYDIEEFDSITMLQENQGINKTLKGQSSIRRMSNIPMATGTIQTNTLTGKSFYKSQVILKNQKYQTKSPQQQNKESKSNTQKQFLVNFKIEDVATLKLRLSSQEPVKDLYVPPSSHQFRNDYSPPESKPMFKTRIKQEPLQNPHGMSEHDQRPQFAIEKELKDKQIKALMEQRKIAEYMGTFVQEQEWVKYHLLADRDHNFVDRKRPEFLDKGNYSNTQYQFQTMLRGESDYTVPFKLFHRQLRRDDKNLFLGQIKESKF